MGGVKNRVSGTDMYLRRGEPSWEEIGEQLNEGFFSHLFSKSVKCCCEGGDYDLIADGETAPEALSQKQLPVL